VILTNICIRTSSAELQNALRATFQPFESLPRGNSGDQLACAMIRWVSTKTKSDDQISAAAAVLRLVHQTRPKEHCTVEFGTSHVSLHTPHTSRTKIGLYWYHSDEYRVEVKFGTKGSETRAMMILEAAERNGVKFDAYQDQKRIERQEVLNALLHRAKQQLEQIKAHPVKISFTARYKATAIAKAQATIAFFEGLMV
jgi:hypothetical protein